MNTAWRKSLDLKEHFSAATHGWQGHKHHKQCHVGRHSIMIHWLSIQEWTAKEKKRKGWQRGPTMPCSFIDSACSLGTKMDLSKIFKTLTHPIRSLSLNVLTKNRTSIRCTCGHLCCRHSLPGQHFRSTPATATTLDTASSQSQYGCDVVTLLCGNTQAGNSTVIVQYINFIQLSSPQTASIGSGIQYRKIGCCTFRTLQATWPTGFGQYALAVERLSAELVDWKQLPLGARRASKISQDICPLQSDNMEYFLYSCRNELVICGHWGF